MIYTITCDWLTSESSDGPVYKQCVCAQAHEWVKFKVLLFDSIHAEVFYDPWSQTDSPHN